MSNINQPINPATTTAPTTAPQSGDASVDAYQRAVQAKPTAFAENPIGAMAGAMDRIGKAATTMLKGTPQAGQDGLASAEAKLMRATQAVRANPNSLAAKQEQLKAALALLGDMQHLAPNDPRRVKIAEFAVKLANQLGPQGIPFGTNGLDVRGLLRVAAQVTSRFGDAAGMQAAFSLEGILRASMPAVSGAEVQARDAFLQQLGIGRSALSMILNNWTVRMAGSGEQPSLDMDSRTLVLNAQQANPSMGVLARAFWKDQSLSNPADKDGFMAAFMKLAASGGAMSVLNRKYKELRRMAQREVASTRVLSTVGASNDAPVLAVGKRRVDDESADMFAALAVFSRTPEGAELPESVQPALQRFFG